MRDENLFTIETRDNFDGDEFSYAKGKKGGKIKKAAGKANATFQKGKAIVDSLKGKAKPAAPAAPGAPAPKVVTLAPKKEGMSTTTKVGIGLGIAALIGGAIWYFKKHKKGK